MGFSVNKTKASPINTGCGHVTKGGTSCICPGGVLWICAAVKSIVFMQFSIWDRIIEIKQSGSRVGYDLP